jgi:hypothetical protein
MYAAIISRSNGRTILHTGMINTLLTKYIFYDTPALRVLLYTRLIVLESLKFVISVHYAHVTNHKTA